MIPRPIYPVLLAGLLACFGTEPFQSHTGGGGLQLSHCLSNDAVAILSTSGNLIDTAIEDGIFRISSYEINDFLPYSDTLYFVDSTVACIIINYSGANCADRVLFTLNCASHKLLSKRITSNCDVDQSYDGEYSSMEYIVEWNNHFRVITSIYQRDSLLRVTEQSILVLPDGDIQVEAPR